MRTGVALLTGIVLIAVIVYSVILLIRQKNEAQAEKRKKTNAREERKLSKGRKDQSVNSRREDTEK